jgi:two-component system, OmpR family, alkaline phosphatase synthesis response regulator PhoP
MHKILIVEDDSSSAEMLLFVLRQEGYEVFIAGNGKEALSTLDGNTIELVLCDLMMPVMDGRELCSAMKANPQFEDIPIIIMSAAPEASVSNTAGDRCYYSSFIRKPLDLDLLTTTVRNLITTT